MSDLFLLLPCFIGIPVIIANSVDSDPTLSVTSDLDLQCLPIFVSTSTQRYFVNAT